MWHQRKLGARALARYAENDSAFKALVKMLDDPDTAVIKVSVESLTVATGRRGLREVLRMLADLIFFAKSCRATRKIWYARARPN
jgi:hypothetical protein